MTNEEILQHHPKLMDMIRDAYQTRSFTHIAELKMFHKSESVDPPTHIPDEDRPDFLYDSFVRPYVGNAVDGFYEYLKTNNNKFRGGGLTRSYYAKFCSIVQSSGTGKSRLMTELRNKGTLVLYMNLRELSDTGFPKRDSVPARILTEYMDCSQAEYTARCCALFGAIFKMLQDDLLTAKLPQLGSGSPDEVIKIWNDHMCDMRSKVRTEFFEKVRSRYQESLNKIKLLASKENTDSNRAAPTVEETSDRMRCMKLEGESFVVEAYKEMLTALPQIFTSYDDGPKLVIGFDEAHPLSKMSSKGFRPSHILCRTIKSYCHDKDTSVWVVFASTTSQVADFSVPQVIHNSLHVAVAGELLYPPYTHLGWDQNADPLSDISANDVAKFHHIVGFGRPLWKSLVGKQSIAEIMTLAAQKLCKSKEFDLTDTNQALAVLSQRFGLNICFGHPDAVSYLEKGVASHLRICFSTTEDRAWTFTGYPSEPLLSCVAALLLHKSPTCLTDALRVLKKKVDGGMVELGQSGELTSRLLLLLAKDMCIRKYLSKDGPQYIRDLHHVVKGSQDAELIDCQKVSIIHFLKYLFGEDFWSTVGEAKTAFQHAYINFSHWVPMAEFISPQDSKETDIESLSARCSAEEWTLRHWHRTSAAQCCHLQPLVDKMIPIYFDDPSLGSDDLNRVSQMFISDKAGKHCNERDLGFITRKHESIQCLSNLPYIALLLDLNVDPKVRVSFPKKEPKHVGTDRCLRIYASGVSDTTFPFLRDSSDVAELLHGLVSRQKEVPSQTSFERLEALVKFGSTARLRHSLWEDQ
ncbi:hypothetical protein DFH29DRAFT_930758 [Suillus ampliporus]|nr:hypothetical protein DFH29DRAFT_930758 [Suillus ampliporus]